MSDEPSRTPEPAPRPVGIYEHYCEHPGCSAWGSYGFTRGKSHPMNWFCYQHRDDGDALLGRSRAPGDNR